MNLQRSSLLLPYREEEKRSTHNQSHNSNKGWYTVYCDLTKGTGKELKIHVKPTNLKIVVKINTTNPFTDIPFGRTTKKKKVV